MTLPMINDVAQVWREPFLIRTQGGPAAGNRVIHDGDLGLSWPLPAELLVQNCAGRYVKTTESELPPQGEDSHLVRGAQYEWQEAADAIA